MHENELAKLILSTNCKIYGSSFIINEFNYNSFCIVERLKSLSLYRDSVEKLKVSIECECEDTNVLNKSGWLLFEYFKSEYKVNTRFDFSILGEIPINNVDSIRASTRFIDFIFEYKKYREDLLGKILLINNN